jgi:hypothetical protein
VEGRGEVEERGKVEGRGDYSTCCCSLFFSPLIVITLCRSCAI